jgi:hypothetical protein
LPKMCMASLPPWLECMLKGKLTGAAFGCCMRQDQCSVYAHGPQSLSKPFAYLVRQSR